MFVELSKLNKKRPVSTKKSKLLKTEAIFYSISLCNKTHPHACICLSSPSRAPIILTNTPVPTVLHQLFLFPLQPMHLSKTLLNFPFPWHLPAEFITLHEEKHSSCSNEPLHPNVWGEQLLSLSHQDKTFPIHCPQHLHFTSPLVPSCAFSTPEKPFPPSICSSFPVPDPFPYSSLSASLLFFETKYSN